MLTLALMTTFQSNGMISKSFIQQSEKQERTIGSFDAIQSTCSVDLYLTQGNSNKVVVEADERYIDQVETYVQNNTLIIDIKGSVRNAKILKAYITFKELKELEISGSGDVVCENKIVTEEFNYKINGSGDLYLMIETGTLECKINGSGDTQIDGDVANFYLGINGSGDIDATMGDMDECMVKLTGSGDVKLSGSAKLFKLKQVSSGDVLAHKLEAVKCIIEKSGSGDSKVHVTGELTVSCSGSGDVYYRGNPKVKNVVITGSGDIYDIN